VKNIKYQISNIKIPIIALTMFSVLFVSASYARTAVESLPQVEKLFMEERYESVVSEAARLIDAGSHGREELFYLKGLSQMRLARYGEARETFEYMVKRYPRGKRAFDGCIGIGDAYFLEGKYPDSITAYNEALSNYPDYKNSSIAYYKIGGAYRKLGNADKGGEYFNRVKDSSPLGFESKMIPKDLAAANAEKIWKPEPKNEPKTESLEYSSVINTGDYYYVQAGYFKSRDNAVKLTEKLKQAGYDSYLSAQVKAGLTFYRVKVGRFKTKPEAEVISRRLKTDGYKTKVCR